MKLHLDKDAFGVLIEAVHVKTGFRSDVIEKDYYVVLILEELAGKQKEGLPAYFKGGTALYKALRTTNRFSEDIDITVDTSGSSRTQNDKILENATKKYISLKREKSRGITNRSSVTAVYQYDPITVFDPNDALQRFGYLKVEATSFTVSEPTGKLEIVPIIYEYATKEQRAILEDTYDIRPFFVETITIERIFVDKLFAAESYTRRAKESHRAFEAAKHLYDLVVMKRDPRIADLMADDELMKRLLDIRFREEKVRLDGIPGVVPSEFVFFEEVVRNQSLKRSFDIMQRQYVLKKSEQMDFEFLCDELKVIKSSLDKNNAWSSYKVQ